MAKIGSRYLLLAAIAVLLAAIGLDFFGRSVDDTRKFVDKVQVHLHDMERDFNTLMEGPGKLTGFFTRADWEDESYRSLFSKSYTVVVYEKDSLVFWNGVNAGIDLEDVDFYLGENRKSGIHKLTTGYYYLTGTETDAGAEILAFLPLKYEYNVPSLYLNPVFALDMERESSAGRVPNSLEVVPPGSEFVLKNLAGESLCSLESDVPVRKIGRAYLLFFLYSLGLILLVIWYTRVCRSICEQKNSMLGLGLFIFGILCGWLAVDAFGLVENFSDIPFLSSNYNPQYVTLSLTKLLVNSALGLWVAIFFHREFRIQGLENKSSSTRFLATILCYIAIVIGILAVTFVLKRLVLETDIPFDFERIANLKFGSFLAILGVLFLMLILFLFTHRMSVSILDMRVQLYHRLFALLIAVLVVFGLAWGLRLDMQLVLLMLFSVIYIVSFDLYVEKEATSFTWLVIWLIIFSAFASAFLYKYNTIKERYERIDYAKILASDRNQATERKLLDLGISLDEDEELNNMIEDGAPYREIFRVLEKNHTIGLRFLDYKYNLHLFDQDTAGNVISFGKGDSEYLDAFDEKDISIDENLRFLRGEELGTYLLKKDFDRSNGNILHLLVSLKRSTGSSNKVYTELFLTNDYRKYQGLSDYDYAVHKSDGSWENGTGDLYKQDTISFSGLPGIDEAAFETHGSWSHLIYRADNGKAVMIGKEIKSFWTKFFSLFSYLFTIIVLMLSILGMINAFVQILPTGLTLSLSSAPSLKNKIQNSVIIVILFSFIVIALVTVAVSNQQNEEYHSGRLERKATGVSLDAAREVEVLDINVGTEDRFEHIVEPLSRIHRLDVNIYGRDGRLIASNMQEVFSKGLVSPLMNAKAYNDLSRGGLAESKQKERIGGLKYDAMYKPIVRNGKLLGYLGLPYNVEKLSNTDDDGSELIERILNIYVLLLILAGAIAIFVANSITRPITYIGENLKQIKLGKKNQPIDYTNKDELGGLVSEYNKMIQKLDDSANLLAQSERESAWREMAKQVAHEIKNPLTPMKLSLQYLQMAYRSNPKDIEPLLKRVSNTLVEQIDNLSHIATEFSNFAKMPRAENEHFVINNLVQSVYDLFSERRDLDMSIHLPKEDFTVFADKNQLMRVFNNLIQNAIQAIHEDRRGDIKVYLRKLGTDKVQLEVKDNGTGIEESMREYIFVPHITTKTEGTGLGLAISRSIIEALDGSIYFTTVVGAGTSFFVELPISNGEA